MISWHGYKTDMNEKGQFLLYDMILALIIIFIILVSCAYIMEGQYSVFETEDNYKNPNEMLNILDSTLCGDKSILYALSEAEDTDNQVLKNKSLSMALEILSSGDGYEYTLKDVTTQTILLGDASDKKRVYTSRKIVNNHIYELSYYSN